MCTSSGLSIAAILPPPLPVSAITRTPSSCAACSASSTFFELPLVEMASSTSPRRPRALGKVRAHARNELRIRLLHVAADSTRSLDIDLELEAPRRVRMRPQAADARAQPLAAIEAPSEGLVLAPRHIAELVSAPGDA